MLNFNNHRAEKQVRDKITSTCEKIKVKPGKINWTYKCHLQSVHFALKKKQKQIAMVMAYDKDGWGCIHFINYKKGKFTDNTWGVWSRDYEYYLIKLIKKKDFFDVTEIFRSYARELRNTLGTYLKLTSNTQW